MENIEKGFAVAKELYAHYGIDVEKALEICDSTPLSVHCWQGDDVVGFEKTAGSLACCRKAFFPGQRRCMAERARTGLSAGVFRLERPGKARQRAKKAPSREGTALFHECMVRLRRWRSRRGLRP